MTRANWHYLRVDDALPDHEKLEGLTPESRALLLGTLVEVWAYCNRLLTDGFIPQPRWPKLGTRKGRALVLARRFADEVDGGYQCRHYLDYQTSRAQVEAYRAAGRKGAGTRWQIDAVRITSSNADRNAIRMGPPGPDGATRTHADRNADRNAVRNTSVPITDNPPYPPAAETGRSTGSYQGRDLGQRTPRADDRPPPASEVCTRCGGHHDRADCPVMGPGPDHPPRRARAAAAAGRQRVTAARPPPVPPRRPADPEVTAKGAALVRGALDLARQQQAAAAAPAQAADAPDEAPAEQPPF